jgi:hypothetical protein
MASGLFGQEIHRSAHPPLGIQQQELKSQGIPLIHDVKKE